MIPSGNTLDESAIELGVYFFAVTICMFYLLDKVKGNVARLDGWLLMRKLEVFAHDDRNSLRATNYIKYSMYVYLALPAITLLGWFSLILFDTLRESRPLVPPFAILLTGLAFLTLLACLFKLSWSNFRFKIVNLVLVLLTVVFLLAYQLITIFGYDNKERFLPYSAIMLNINVIIMCILVFLVKGDQSKDQGTLLRQFFPKLDVNVDPNREDNLVEEINSQIKDENWKNSLEDLTDLVTIAHVSHAKFLSVVGGRALGKYADMSFSVKLGIKIGLFVLAGLVLVGYSLLLFFLDNWSKMGIVISISVVCMDIFNLLLYMANMVDSAALMSFLLIVNRLAMVGLGENYWLYGFMILYVIYAGCFVFQMSKKMFPLNNEILVKEVAMADLLKKAQGAKKKGDKEAERAAEDEIQSEGIHPAILLVVLSILYLVLLLLVEFINFQGKNLKAVPIGITKEKLNTGIAAGLSYYSVLTLFLIFCLGRIYIRKATKCEKYGTEGNCFARVKVIDTMTFYIMFLWLVGAGWGGFLFWALKSNTSIIYGTCGTPCVLFYLRGLVFFILNEFDMHQDVEKLNKQIDAHNEKVDALDKLKRETQQALADGTLVLPLPEDELPQVAEDQPPSAEELERRKKAEEEAAAMQAEIEKLQADLAKSSETLAEEARKRQEEEKALLLQKQEADRLALEAEKAKKIQEEIQKLREEGADDDTVAAKQNELEEENSKAQEELRQKSEQEQAELASKLEQDEQQRQASEAENQQRLQKLKEEQEAQRKAEEERKKKEQEAAAAAAAAANQPDPAEEAKKQEEQQRKLREAIEKEQEQKKQEEEARRKAMESEEAQKAEKERQERMAEQQRLEQEREAERKKKLEEEKKKKREEEAKRQAAEEAARNARNKYEFDGKVQMGEIVDYSKVKPSGGRGGGGDAMYEGGEGDEEAPGAPGAMVPEQSNAEPADQNVNTLMDATNTDQQALLPETTLKGDEESMRVDPKQVDVKVDDGMIDLDEVMEREDGFKVIASSKLRRVTDWRLMHKNSACSALTAGDLRPNDYKIIFSMSASLVFWIVLMSCLLGLVDGETGAISSTPLLYIGVCALLASSAVYQSRAFSMLELGLWIGVNVFYIGFGVAFFIYQYEVSTFKYDLNSRSRAQELAAIFVTLFLLFVPTLSHALVWVLRYADRGAQDLWKDCAYFIVATGVGLLLMVVAVFLFVHWIEGVAFIVALILIVYFVAQAYIYVTHGFKMPWKWPLINGILVTVLVLTAFIWSIADPRLSMYEGATISALTLLVFLWGYGTFNLVYDVKGIEDEPVYYSMTLFPIFKYDASAGSVVEHYEPTAAWMAGIALLSFWAFLTAHQMRPHWLGPVVLVVLQILFLLSLFFINSLTLEALTDAFDFMDEQVARSAWLSTKLDYAKRQSTMTRKELRTYRRAWIDRYYAENHLNCLRQAPLRPPAPEIGAVLKDSLPRGPVAEVAPKLRQYVQGMLQQSQHSHLDINSETDMATLVHELYFDVGRRYRAEMELTVRWVLLASQNARALKNQEKKRFFRFIDDKQKIFHALGIKITVPASGSIEQRYRELMLQIDGLEPDQSQLFKQVRALHDQQIKKKHEEAKLAEEAKRKKEEERQRQAEEAARAKEEELARLQQELLGNEGAAAEERRKAQEAAQEALRQQQEAERLRADQAAREAAEAELARLRAEQADEAAIAAREAELEAERQRQAEELKKREEEERQRLAEQQRAEEAAARAEELTKQGDEEKIDETRDPNSMPDCLYKYKLIRKRAKMGLGKFEDTKFKAETATVGAEVMNNNLGNAELYWKRVGEVKPNTPLYHDGVDVNDITQGALGDCYYLSALGVLGNRGTRDCFFSIENPEEWRELGALCVRFYIDGKPDYVIIDDKLPMMKGDRYPFVSIEHELWPAFMEKAYAKRYGTYSIIEGGVVSYALEELTGGVPEVVDMNSSSNPVEIWGKLKAAQKAGALLGAGTPGHPEGDKARSTQGIVLQHAYSLYRAEEVDGIKLVQLRNPHGEGEWTGDWSDKSSKWTKRMRNMLNYHDNADDGVFWMELSDFMTEYDSIYICTVYNKDLGWNEQLFNGEWMGKYAAGLYHKGNPNCNEGNNPQFSVTVNGPGDAVCVLRICGSAASRRGGGSKDPKYAMLAIQSNKGQPMKDLNMDKTLANTGNPRPGTSVMEFKFPDKGTYTLMCASYDGGKKGEAKFNCSVYTKNQESQVAKLN